MSAPREGFGKPGVWVDAGEGGMAGRGGEGRREDLEFGMAKGEVWVVGVEGVVKAGQRDERQWRSGALWWGGEEQGGSEGRAGGGEERH